MTHLGLYYPFIHFKDDNWLKATALYWDKMARIVPRDYDLCDDSDTVKKLVDLDYVVSINPETAATSPVRPTQNGQPIPLSRRFGEVLKRHASALTARYDVSRRDTWPVARTACTGMPGTDPKLHYVNSLKIDDDITRQLVAAKLVLRMDESNGVIWLGMHPNLASVYMAALADEIAAANTFSPVTDETLDHIAVGGWSVERLAFGLLGKYDETVLAPEPVKNGEEISDVLAHIALQSVVPKNLDALTVERIAQLRKQYPEERKAFREWTHSLAPTLLASLADVRSNTALDAHLKAFAETSVIPQVKKFHTTLNSVGIDALIGVMNIQLTVPKLLESAPKLLSVGGAAAAGSLINPVVGVTAAVGVGLLPIVRDARRKAQEAVEKNPVSYLMQLEEDLQPATFYTRVTRRLRKFVLGV